MALNDEQSKLLAAALCEIRILLQVYDGDDTYILLTERLAYALHNDALNVIEGDSTFDPSESRRRIEGARQVLNAHYPDVFGILGAKRD